MYWKKNDGFRTFVSSKMLDMDSPVRVGEQVTLRTADGLEFEVEVARSDGEGLQGVILRIGPDRQLEAHGLKRGDSVSFSNSDVYVVNHCL